ncbi:hypothetical protein HHO41_07375 [Bacillus sp. DNRA2]|uniref:hypothetical protein n=1 Tax=Bacillus sp. DNRA2 TaxID=2723053 RepID=UPI00145FCD86|nr:hypothetical protein [Bacillus sp. DNRA2]NMD70107.1 hypothetical protein [Bacillus sp. DNRA2]
MKKKLFALMGSAILSATMLVGCADNDTDNPPPENNGVNVKNYNDRNNRILDRDRDNNGILDDRDGINNGNNRVNNRNNGTLPDTRINDTNRNGTLPDARINDANRNGTLTPDTRDRNTRNDLDPARDNNGRGEDLIEDRNDARDRDNKDE